MKNNRVIENKFGTVFARSGDEFKVQCPKCSHKSMWVNPKKGVFVCFYCDYKGLLQHSAQTGVNFALKEKDTTVFNPDAVLPYGYAAVKTRTDFIDGWDYIASRGVDPTFVEFGFVDQQSVVFPARENGRVVYWQSRMLGDIYVRKTNNPSRLKCELGKSDIVYRIDDARQNQPMRIVEGVFDALVVNGQATYGKKMSVTQAVKILSKSPSMVLVCYDADAWESSVWASSLLRGMTTLIPVLPVRLDVGDPADKGPEGLEKFVQVAITKSLESGYLRLFPEWNGVHGTS